MTEDTFDPFEEDHAASEAPPRVHKPYTDKSGEASEKPSRAFWSRFQISSDGLLLIGKSLLVLAMILAYPVMTVMAHQIDDRPVVFDDSRFWAVPEVGVTSVLIGRELDGPGWAADRHPWHPQARLTALPAWQDSLLNTLADHGRLLISQLGNQQDPDLVAAVRLLDPSDKQNTTDRLLAAGEAFARYDDRVAGGVTTAPTGMTPLLARLGIASQWASDRHIPLAAAASPGDGWIASPEAIEAVYAAKASAHVAHEMLSAIAGLEDDMLNAHDATHLMQDVLTKWRRAASMRPLFIANQSGEAISGLNHPAIMAFRLSEARKATQQLAAHLQAPQSEAALETPGEIAQLIQD